MARPSPDDTPDDTGPTFITLAWYDCETMQLLIFPPTASACVL